MRPTPRGIALGAAGAVLAIVAASTSSLVLARIAAVPLMVVALAAIWIVVSRKQSERVRLQRRISPPRPTVGQIATVHLSVAGGTLPTFARLRERTPSGTVHQRPTAVGNRRNEWAYKVQPGQRGYHLLGPSTVLHGDPLGVLRWSVQGDAGGHMLVWPRRAHLDQSLPLADLQGSEHSPTGTPHRSVEDLTLREYVVGDDVHRVHWRSSARRGELMVRADEPSNPFTIDMFLSVGRTGMGTEWATSAFASLAVAVIDSNIPVQLHLCREVWQSTEPELFNGHVTDTFDALDQIAPATRAPAALQAEQLTGLRQAGPCLVAVLTEPDESLIENLVGLANNRRAYALIVMEKGQLPSGARHLQRHGWIVIGVRAQAHTQTIAAVWKELLDPAMAGR